MQHTEERTFCLLLWSLPLTRLPESWGTSSFPASKVATLLPQRSPKPANQNEARDVDSGGRRIRRHTQRLERRKKTTNESPGTAALAFAAYRAGDRGAPGDSRWLPEGGRDRSAAAGWVGPRRPPAKPANEATRFG